MNRHRITLLEKTNRHRITRHRITLLKTGADFPIGYNAVFSKPKR